MLLSLARDCFLHSFALLLFLATEPFAASPLEAWEEVSTWMRKHGATVSRHLRSNETMHEGLAIRGLTTVEDLPAGAVVMEVPLGLQLKLDRIPEINKQTLSALPACSAPSSNIRGKFANDKNWHPLLKMAAVLAVETHISEASFFYPWIKWLPSMRDFNTFYPPLMDATLLKAFDALPLIREVQEMQTMRKRFRKCFENWQRTSGATGSLFGLAWEEFELALMRVCTTAISGAASDDPIMIPGVDWLNTETRSATNSVYSYSDVGGYGARVRIGRRGAPAGAELSLAYCQSRSCGNDHMLLRWGVYLESNEFQLTGHTSQTKAVHCVPYVRQDTASASSLQIAAEEVLDLDDVSHQRYGWHAPRCHGIILGALTEQGPMRCSLARLAWELCAQNWGYEHQTITHAVFHRARSWHLSVPTLGPGIVAQAASIPMIALCLWPTQVMISVLRNRQGIKFVRIYNIVSIYVFCLLLHVFCVNLPLPGTPCFLIIVVQALCLVVIGIVGTIVRYERDSKVVHIALGTFMTQGVILALVAAVFIRCKSRVEGVGHATALAAVFMVGSPLLCLPEILREGCHACLPRGRCVLGHVSSGLSLWVAFLHGPFPPSIYFASATGFVLSCIQLVLMVVLPLHAGADMSGVRQVPNQKLGRESNEEQKGSKRGLRKRGRQRDGA